MNPIARTGSGPVHSDEHEQAVIRLVIVGLLIAYCLYYFLPGGIDDEERIAMWFGGFYFVVSIAVFLSVRRAPKFSPSRVLATIAADLVVTSYWMYQAGPVGAILFFVYLWLIIGNGFRYGLPYLFLSMVLSIVGFGVVVGTSDYWANHRALSASLFIGLVALPLFTTMLVRRLHDALRRAEEASQAKSQFLARMSHELRTPLHAIVSTADLLSTARYTQEQQGVFSILRNSIDALLRQVDQVLDFSKIEAGRMERSDAPFNLHTMLAATVSIFQARAMQKGLRLTLDVAPGVPDRVNGDARHLGEILQNLIGNAVKFTAAGDITVRVVESPSVPADESTVALRFEVKDTGIGIGPEFLPQLFERFAQEDDSRTRHFEGSGLGTAIAKQLVELLGGTIGADSVKAVGSTFWFELRFGRCAEQPEATVMENPVHAAPGIGRDRHILVADDNAINRMLIEKLLIDAGYRVTMCDNGDAALAALARSACDLAILDVHMPDKGGLEVVHALRAANMTSNVRLMVLTADATVATRRQCEELGLSYVAKPVRREALLAAIESLLCGRAGTVDVAEVKENSDVILDQTTMATIVAVAGGKSEFVCDVLQLFCAQATEIVERIGAALANHDREQIAELVHKLQGSAGTVGAMNIVAACRALETELHGAECATLLEGLRDAVAAAVGAIHEQCPRAAEMEPRRFGPH